MKCCDLNAGKLIHKVSFQEQDLTPNMRGGGVVKWVEVANLWCFVKPVSANESMQLMRLNARTTHKIYTRYRTDLNESMKVVFNNREMQIRGIINIEERNMWLEISAEEGEPA